MSGYGKYGVKSDFTPWTGRELLAKRMEVYGWGRYPRMEAEFYQARDDNDLRGFVTHPDRRGALIASGSGRSYGDSALAEHLINTRYLDSFIDFDRDGGVLSCAAGVTLDSILQVCIPRGWFPPVLPGTRFVTVGGAIAADIHGKNHHLNGSFCGHLISFSLLLAGGEIRTCSTSDNPELFHATCGGMGLTGVITRATLQLQRVPGVTIRRRTLAAANLDHCMDIIEENATATYSVAWLDCLAGGGRTGRGLVYLGEHAADENYEIKNRLSFSVPFNSPAFLLNNYTVKAFNGLLYSLQNRDQSAAEVPYDKFFFPLDNIRHWNRLYGRRGFLQYQFVMPQEPARQGIETVLKKVARAGKGSFLTVLKQFGPANGNLLSFPLAGYTLALDFKYQAGLLPLLEELDAIVTDHGGRLYLAKDARMSEATFKRGYPNWEKFVAVKQQYDPDGVFGSLQSRRLGLTE